MAKSNVKAHRRQGKPVRAHSRARKPARNGADDQAAVNAAAAAADAETTLHADGSLAGVAESDGGGLYDIVGSLARRGNPETDAQQRLAGALKEFFGSLESWKGALLSHADVMSGCKLNGRNLVWAAVHMRRLTSEGKTPTGVMLPRTTWEQQHQRQVTGDGFGITVPRNWSATDTETDPDTGEETETTRSGVSFTHGGKNRRYYDACETEGDTPFATEQTLLAEAAEQARVGRGNLTAQQVAEIKTGYLDKAASMGLTVEYSPRAEMGGAHGYYDIRRQRIVLSEEADDAEQTSVLVHELAHASDPALAGPPEEAIRRYKRDRAACEYVAESVAFAVLDRHGLDSAAGSALYLHHWKPERLKQAKNIYDRCVKAMDNLIERPSSDDNSGSESG